MTGKDAAQASVVLLSGGLDSVTVLAVAASQGHRVHALSFNYGQRHAVELQCAARQAKRFGAVAHEVVDLSHLGRLVAPATALVEGSALSVPKVGADGATSDAIPVTYVPARNTVFLSLALALAEVLEAQEIWIGVNAVDYSGYPDCRPEFIAAFQEMAALATKVGVEGGPAPRIVTPLIDWSKADIIRRGQEVGVDYSLTVTCYDPDTEGRACGHCEACLLRKKGFVEAAVPDPTLYR